MALTPSVWCQELPEALPPRPASSAVGPVLGDGRVTVEQLAERLRLMEESNRQLAGELDRRSREHAEQMRRLLGKYDELSRRLGSESGTGRAAEATGPEHDRRSGDARAADEPGTPIPDYYSFETEQAPPTPRYRISNIVSPGRIPVKGAFGPGFEWRTDDEEFRLQVHVLSQTEGRVWGQSGEATAHSGLYFPRQRIFFNGRITRPIEYVFSINRGLNSLDLLDAYINYHPTSRFQLRIGRYMTPLTYDQFAIRPMWLPTPERSLFTTVLGLNRQIGAMAWGHLFDDRLDYASGIFNGSRNSFQTLNDSVDWISFLNLRPFQRSDSFWFAQFLNLGSSVAYGYQDQPPVPRSFRIGAVSPDAAVPGVATIPFLILQPDVIEKGERLLGSVHAAYFFRGLSLIGEWQYGFSSYAAARRPYPAAVPVSGYYATAAYFLTGEHVESRTMIQPRRPFFPTRKDQSRGPGAWEVVARVSELRLGERVFNAGFADPNLWSNSAVTTELGLNWYLNEHFKIYMFWLHGEFGDPVVRGPGTFQRNADMLWLRMQLWF